MEVEGEESSQERRPDEDPPASLFPVFPSSTPPPTASADPNWLFNSSFTFDASAIQPPPASNLVIESDEEEDAPAPREAPPSYDLVGSPSSPSDEGRGRHRERGDRRRKKKRRRKRDEQGDHGESRKSGVRAWVGSDSKPDKDYHFDVRGDRDILAFGSLYRMDVARYKRHSPTELSEDQVQIWYRWRPWDSLMELDGDIDVLDSKLRAAGRYYSAKYSNLERHKDFKHLKFVMKQSSPILGDFIPLIEYKGYREDSSGIQKGESEESWDEEVLQRTREFNKKTREFPHDEKVWIEFADFQDKIANMQPQKAARLQTLEKKISILEKAVDLNPESEELLLCLLKSYEKRDSGEDLIARWEKILMQNYGSCRLWKEFLLVVQGEFSRFKVSEVRKRYAHAIQALTSASSRLSRQGGQPAKSPLSDPELVEQELGLVDIFISLCRFEWQSGYQELATGLFQAGIEYSLFCPSLQLSSRSKLRLFEHFWNSDGARVGEEGAVGWSVWIEKEEENRQEIVRENSVAETETGGWTGWFDPLKNEEINKKSEKSDDGLVGEGEIEEDLETEDIQHEDDVETLLQKLGVNVDAEPHSEIKDSITWNRWSEEEVLRDCNQWMPVRENSDRDDDQLSRAVLFEDVADFLFSLYSQEARFHFISRFTDFFGGKISQWSCTNSPSWIANIMSLDAIPDSILEHLKDAFALLNKDQSCSRDSSLEVFTGTDDMQRTDIIKFLRNSLLLCLNVFPRNYVLEEALLIAEELLLSRMNPSACLAMPPQALAKRLLKNDRQDLLLSGLYARREAAHGNLDRARKVFDMTLSLVEDLPPDLKENKSLLYLWYAEMELENSNNVHESSLRAIHILSSLGSSAAYIPFTGPVSGLQLLKAHNGFREQIKCLQSAWARGSITDQSIAIVCSASLFEILTSGWQTAIEVIEEAFFMALPERRHRSLQLESLCLYYIKLLRKYLKKIKLSKVWNKLLQQLQTYPYNPKILSSIIEVGHIFTVPQKIRHILDEHSQRKPSVLVLLFALSFELGRPSSQHRIRGLFERALANDKLQKSVILWRCYLAFEFSFASNPSAARRVYFRAIHACPWSKKLWLDGFHKLSSILNANELSDLHEVMRDKELNLRTDIYEILLQDEFET